MRFLNKLKIEDVPVSLDEYNKWTEEVIALTRLPLNDSMRFAVSTVVLESKELLSKKDAAIRLLKGANNQLASFVFQDIKSRRMAEDAKKAEEEKKASDAETTASQVVS